MPSTSYINSVGLKCVRRETLLQPHCCRHETQRTVQQSPLSVSLPPQTALKPCCYLAPWHTSKTATQTPRSAFYGVEWRKTALILQRQRHWHRGQWRCVHGSLAIYNRTPTSAEVLNSLKLPPRLAFHGVSWDSIATALRMNAVTGGSLGVSWRPNNRRLTPANAKHERHSVNGALSKLSY